MYCEVRWQFCAINIILCLSLLCVYFCIMFNYVMLRMLVNLTIRNAHVWSLGYIGAPLGPIHNGARSRPWLPQQSLMN